MRAQYPGFKEYIDQQFSKVTGENPANAKISHLTQEINRAASSMSLKRIKCLVIL